MKEEKNTNQEKEKINIEITKKNWGRFEILCVLSGVNPTQENFNILLENYLIREIEGWVR
jgi:hypothetical protein